MDAGNHAELIFLDLSAVFDTTDHWILLKQFVGIHGTVLKWFVSYLGFSSF